LDYLLTGSQFRVTPHLRKTMPKTGKLFLSDVNKY